MLLCLMKKSTHLPYLWLCKNNWVNSSLFNFKTLKILYLVKFISKVATGCNSVIKFSGNVLQWRVLKISAEYVSCALARLLSGLFWVIEVHF